MARPKSENKRRAILDAAVEIFAERGAWSTPTSAISKKAGVAEGTLFTFFATKDVLMNELYRALKLEYAAMLLAAFPDEGSFRDQFRHVWNQIIEWGLQNPKKMKVLAELRLSEKITEETKAIGWEAFARLEKLLTESMRQKKVRALSRSFMGSMMAAMSETTTGYIAQESSGKATVRTRHKIRDAGFEMFWKAIAVE